MSDLPRFEILIQPEGDEFSVAIKAHAPNVVVSELVQAVLRAALLLSTPGQTERRWPTVDEVMAREARFQLLQSNPATRLFVRGGDSLWLSERALNSYFVTVSGALTSVEPGEPVEGDLVTLDKLLDYHGWISAGPSPADVNRACDYLTDPQSVLSRIATT